MQGSISRIKTIMINNQWQMEIIIGVERHSHLYVFFSLTSLMIMPCDVSEWRSEGVKEWVLFNANSAIFQPHYGENKLIFNEIMMMMRSALF
jgi:hypothetical protein